MTQVNIHIAKNHLSKLIQKALLDEEVIIARNNKPLVKIIPLIPHKRRLGTAKGYFWIADNFNEPLESFKDYEK